MKKIILYVLLFAALIGGATFLYNSLGDSMKEQEKEALKTPAPTAVLTEKEEAPAPAVPTETEKAPETESEPATEPEVSAPVEETVPTEYSFASDLDFRMLNAEGEELLLSEVFSGKPMVLNFWASWCGPCKMEMPEFEALSKELAGEVDFVMVNLTDGGRETLESAKAFIEDSGYSFPVYFDSFVEGAYTYYVNSIPMSYFFNARGELVNAYVGAMDEAALRQYIDEARNS